MRDVNLAGFDEEDDEIVETEWREEAGIESDKQKQFKADMEEAGLRVEFYGGRFFYEGWAVRTEDLNGLQDAIRATKIYVQWDTMGLGNIVYPQS